MLRMLNKSMPATSTRWLSQEKPASTMIVDVSSGLAGKVNKKDEMKVGTPANTMICFMRSKPKLDIYRKNCIKSSENLI